MKTILLLYSTTDGHTRCIAEKIASILRSKQAVVDLMDIASDPSFDIKTYGAILIGASIRYGKHGKAIIQFIEQNHLEISSRPNAFFSVNLVARKPEKQDATTNPYVRKFLKNIRWKPMHSGVFAGKLDYPSYGFWDRIMIQLIMKMTKGPTDPTLTIEYTDWNRVEQFAGACAHLFGLGERSS